MTRSSHDLVNSSSLTFLLSTPLWFLFGCQLAGRTKLRPAQRPNKAFFPNRVASQEEYYVFPTMLHITSNTGMQALNPNVDWNAVEEAYLGNGPVEIVHIDEFFSQKALAILLDIAHGSSIFVDVR